MCVRFYLKAIGKNYLLSVIIKYNQIYLNPYPVNVEYMVNS
jgi:HD superfamily phosphohydrolase